MTRKVEKWTLLPKSVTKDATTISGMVDSGEKREKIILSDTEAGP